jgi:hypothetical protein
MSAARRPDDAGMCALNEHGQGVASTSAETYLYKAMPGLAGV